MKSISALKFALTATFLLSQSITNPVVADDNFAPGEWCPAHITVVNPANGHLVPLVLSKCGVTIGYYVPDSMALDPDDKLCRATGGELCILERPKPTGKP